VIGRKIIPGISGWGVFNRIKNKIKKQITKLFSIKSLKNRMKHLAGVMTILSLLSSSLLISVNVVGEGESITLDPVDAYYLRGDTVFINGSITPPEADKYVGIEVQDCNSDRIIFLSPTTNDTGYFSTNFVIPTGTPFGVCTIYASYGDARANTTFILCEEIPPQFSVSNPYPANESTEISRPPTNISIQVNGTNLNIYFYFYNMTPVTDTWTQFASWTGVSTGRYNFTDFTERGNDFLWGNTTYYWWVNVTDGSAWVNKSYSYTTVELANGANARLDVDNDANVFVGDLNDVWANRNGQATYDGIYDVDDDGNVFVGDLNTIWAGRS